MVGAVLLLLLPLLEMVVLPVTVAVPALETVENASCTL